MKRRLRVYGGIVLGLVFAYSILDYFSVEAMNLAWHLHHGFHAELGGIRMRVPLSFEADDPQGLASLTLMRRGGRLWHGGGLIMIGFRSYPREARQAIEAKVPPNESIKTDKVDERTMSFAGRTGTCIESIPHLPDSRADAMLQAMHPRDIDCWFGLVEVEFLGTANLKEEFYSIIQTAEPVGRKN